MIRDLARLLPAIIFSFLIFFGCDKRHDQPAPGTGTDRVGELKTIFDQRGYSSSLTDKYDDSTNIGWNPDWKSVVSSKPSDSVTYYYVALQPKLILTDGRPLFRAIQTTNYRRYLLVRDVKGVPEFTLAAYVSDSSTFDRSPKFFTNFSGVLLGKSLDTRRGYRYLYSQGRPGVETTGSRPKQSTDYETVCYTVVTCYWTASCGNTVYVTTTSGAGACQPPNTAYVPCDLPPLPGVPTDANYYKLGSSRQDTYCQTIWVDNPPPPPPGGGNPPPPPPGGGSGGGGTQGAEIVMTNPENTEADDTNNPTTGDDNNTYAPWYQGPWPVIANLIAKGSFVGISAAHENCLSLAKAQLKVAGYQISNYGEPGQTYQVYTEAGGMNKTNSDNAVGYLNAALGKGIPVVVGVDDAPGSSNPMTDNSTDHFVVIVGSGTDAKGNFYRFYDNSTSWQSTGTSDDNKLYYNPTTGMIEGQSQTTYASNCPHDYILTQVRKSKPL